MVVDFSNIDVKEKPVLILKNTSGTPLGTLGSAYGVKADIKYNEVSTLEFNLPAYIGKTETPKYNSVIGMRIIDLQGIGQFVLMNPKETCDGTKTIKACKGYSLEYEFTFKKITLENGTYNFWNPAAPGGTILGIILELMPSWSVGTVDSSLVGKYRTYEVSDENLYNFIKNTLQQSYNCIFDFDTYNRTINVRDVSSSVSTEPIFISCDNLAKEIEVEEDTENIITRIDVNGADGVDIRDVNPSGTNKIINLDYFMTTDNFEQSLINKYNSWKSQYSSYQLQYYNLSIEYSIQVMRKTAESAKLVDLEGELTSLENQQAVIIRAIAETLSQPSELTSINASISAKQSEIDTQKSLISSISAGMETILDSMRTINQATDFQDYFTASEYQLLDKYIRDDSVSESSFVVQEVKDYGDDGLGNTLTNKNISISGGIVTTTAVSGSNKTIYEVKGGNLSISGIVTSNIIRSVFEKSNDGSFVMTAYIGKGSSGSMQFDTACLSISGSCGSVSSSATSLSARASSAYLYLTQNSGEYEKRAVAWDLYEFGNEILTKISQPSYKFSVSSANFLFIDEFELFKNSLKHGEKVYVGLSDDKTLAPIVIGCTIDYESPNNLTLEFSDTYVSGDSAFQLADLLEQSISMGKNVDIGKYTYSAFVDSGAHTQVKDFMTSALDVAKNAIISSNNQAITWGDSGIRMRKWSNDAHTAYSPEQIWLNNNSILMTSDNWNTAEIAIGAFEDANLGRLWGVVAPNIVGTLLAGNNLVVESAKKDGGVAVFKVDASGCTLHNSNFSITSSATKTQVFLDAEHGIVVGKNPLINSSGAVDTDNYRFWVDSTGNLFFKGTLKATNGEFDGKVTAREGFIGNGNSGWTIADSYIYNGKPAYSNTTSGIYIGTNGISLGDATNQIKLNKNGTLTANNATITGSITTDNLYASGGTITGSVSIAAAAIKSGTIDSARIPNLSANKITTGTLSADRISGGTFDASTMTVKNLRADSITVGTLSASQISGLPASQITSGTFATARIPNLSANKITSGSIDASTVTITNLNADNITSGTISAGRISGGTLSGCSLSIGGTFLVNSSSGLVSLRAGLVRVYSTSNVGTLGVGYHYGQTFDMYVVCNTFLGLATSGINLCFVSGICCGYYA